MTQEDRKRARSSKKAARRKARRQVRCVVRSMMACRGRTAVVAMDELGLSIHVFRGANLGSRPAFSGTHAVCLGVEQHVPWLVLQW